MFGTADGTPTTLAGRRTQNRVTKRLLSAAALEGRHPLNPPKPIVKRKSEEVLQ
jgi:hypothetical protein